MNPVADASLREWVILRVTEDVDFKQEMVYMSGNLIGDPRVEGLEWVVEAHVPGASSGDL